MLCKWVKPTGQILQLSFKSSTHY
uniref:Uncharacterized protein n=1 Tax=Rhizophora mucronata TaxID=61149 RepID=A0A2P2QF09_RHIMU